MSIKLPVRAYETLTAEYCWAVRSADNVRIATDLMESHAKEIVHALNALPSLIEASQDLVREVVVMRDGLAVRDRTLANAWALVLKPLIAAIKKAEPTETKP